MNSPRTTFLGWGLLIAGAGVSFYYAKKSINERRKLQAAVGARPVEKLDWRTKIAQQEREAARIAEVGAVGKTAGAEAGPKGENNGK